MHLLWRQISAYTGSDLCLGVFRTREKAEQARSEYIRRIAAGEIEDHWAEQSYHRVDLEADVQIRSDVACHDLTADQGQAFLVSEIGEGCGQEDRSFVALCGSEASADTVCARLNDQPHTLPFYTDVEPLHLDTLVLRPEQPSDRIKVWMPEAWNE